MKSVISATILCFAISTSAAFAQSPAVAEASAAAVTPVAATTPPPAAKSAKPALSPDEKKKISQECSAQANDKQLHGKDRQKFRASCIKRGGASA